MSRATSRRALLAWVGSAAIAGCVDVGGRDTADTTDETDDADSASLASVEEVELESGFDPTSVGGSPPDHDDQSVDAPPVADRTLPLVVSPAELAERAVDGGPSKDGIPSIDDPSFLPADDATELADDDVVLGVARGGEAKAYRRGMLVHHEIVNDTIGGDPVAVTYCPLTGTAQGFERGATEFGVSGMLVNNNLIMYDRARDRWWPQIAAVSVPSPWTDAADGTALREFSVVRTTWGRWRRAHPETTVLDVETDFARDYDRDPYAERGYYQLDGTLFENLHEQMGTRIEGFDRHHAKEWVYGARTGEGAVAFRAETLQSVGLIPGRIDDVPVIGVYDPDLDTAYVYRNPAEESFEYDAGTVLDAEGRRYDPASLPLDRIVSFDAYWFAWAAFYPNTTLYE